MGQQRQRGQRGERDKREEGGLGEHIDKNVNLER